MKKVIVIFLVIVSMLMLCACADTCANLKDAFGKAVGQALVSPAATENAASPGATAAASSPDAGKYEFGENWPDNEFTRLIEKPDFGKIVGTSSSKKSFECQISDATVDQLKEYAKKLKALGFSENVDVEDSELIGIKVYGYTADNAEGYHVEVVFAIGISVITVSK